MLEMRQEVFLTKTFYFGTTDTQTRPLKKSLMIKKKQQINIIHVIFKTKELLLYRTSMIFPLPIVTNNPQLYCFYVVVTNLCVIHFCDLIRDPHYGFQLI